MPQPRPEMVGPAAMRWHVAVKTGSEMVRVGSFGDVISWVYVSVDNPRGEPTLTKIIMHTAVYR